MNVRLEASRIGMMSADPVYIMTASGGAERFPTRRVVIGVS
jgi:hypothetical protein